jgi:hypothetical protein
MTGRNNLFFKRMNKRDIISIGMMICFIVSYLPVTSSWYISLNGRLDLSRLVISAMTMKNHIDRKSPEKELARSIDSVFKELKIATGQVKIHKTPEKKALLLTEILPEYPVLKFLSNLNSYQDFFILIPYKNVFYQTDQLPPEPPPPELMFVS